ncbi:MAG: hypothetical protein H0T73_13240 [Ardenticatenales bacterium]|nr:hypothetical protein [Ardenticatenales bacterium]
MRGRDGLLRHAVHPGSVLASCAARLVCSMSFLVIVETKPQHFLMIASRLMCPSTLHTSPGF